MAHHSVFRRISPAASRLGAALATQFVAVLLLGFLGVSAQADAANTEEAAFQAWLTAFRAEAAAAGISAQTLDAALSRRTSFSALTRAYLLARSLVAR